jgi:hypothetical protein
LPTDKPSKNPEAHAPVIYWPVSARVRQRQKTTADPDRSGCGDVNLTNGGALEDRRAGDAKSL